MKKKQLLCMLMALVMVVASLPLSYVAADSCSGRCIYLKFCI